LVDGAGEPRVFVTLQVGFEIIFCKTFVDLRWIISTTAAWLDSTRTYLREGIFLVGVFVSKLPNHYDLVTERGG
jgi:hypothetical protein